MYILRKSFRVCTRQPIGRSLTFNQFTVVSNFLVHCSTRGRAATAHEQRQCLAGWPLSPVLPRYLVQWGGLASPECRTSCPFALLLCIVMATMRVPWRSISSSPPPISAVLDSFPPQFIYDLMTVPTSCHFSYYRLILIGWAKLLVTICWLFKPQGSS